MDSRQGLLPECSPQPLALPPAPAPLQWHILAASPPSALPSWPGAPVAQSQRALRHRACFLPQWPCQDLRGHRCEHRLPLCPKKIADHSHDQSWGFSDRPRPDRNIISLRPSQRSHIIARSQKESSIDHSSDRARSQISVAALTIVP